MSQQPITVTLSDELYERIREIAEESDRSLEAVVLESLDLLFPNSENEAIALDDMQNYSDEQLWAIVHRRMSWSDSTRLHELSQKSKLTSLTVGEQSDLDRLLERVDYDLLLRSEALLQLKLRGYEVAHFFAPLP